MHLIVRTFLLPLLFCVRILSGQDHGFFKQIWLDEGLSQSSITAIASDKTGFMWFGTQDGLNRFDGRRIEKFNFQPFGGNSLISDNIMSLVSEDEIIWAQSFEGIDVIDISTLTIRNLYNLAAQEKKVGSALYPIRLWNVENIVYAFARGGVFELRKSSGSVSWNKLFSNSGTDSKQPFGVKKIVAGPSNSLLLATTDGIFTYDKTERRLHRFELENSQGKKNFPAESADLIFDGESVIFSQGNAVVICNLSTKTVTEWKVPCNGNVQINALLKDNRGRIWVGTVGEGIYILEIAAYGNIVQQKHFKKTAENKYGLNCDFINCFFQKQSTDEDIVWIGTRDAGVFQYSYSANSFSLISAPMKLPAQNFFSITQDSSGHIWASTNTGLVRFSQRNKEYSVIDLTQYDGMPYKPVEASFTDSAGRVWCALSNKLYMLDTKNSRLVIEDPALTSMQNSTIYTITGVNRDNLILGTQAGIIFYDVKNHTKRILDTVEVNGRRMQVPSTAGLCVDRYKSIWAATHNGLLVLSHNGRNRFYRNSPTDTTSLLSNVVMTVCEGKDGKMLIGTTKGLSILEKNSDDRFTNYFSVPGLSNNFIYGIVRDDEGKYWMSTNYGIAVFDIESRKFRTYTAADGTSLNEFNSSGYYKTSDGQLLFGALGGLIGVYPNRLTGSRISPEVVMSRAVVGELEFSNVDELKNYPSQLGFDHHMLLFDFSVLDLKGPSHSRLYFSLEASDKDNWVEAKGEKLIRLGFANLAPGDYTLKVKAVSVDGLESSQPLLLKFTVNPPFWHSTWFYMILLAVVLAGTYVVYRVRLRNRIAMLKKMEQIRQEENERVRKAAALDLHDEFGNGLTRISMLVETLKMKIPEEQKDVRVVLNVISENTLRLYNGTKDFIWSINPTNDNLYETLIRIKDFGDEIFFDSGTDFKAEGLDEKLKEKKHAPGTGRNLVMIFKEAISNAVKHSGASNVKLHVEEQPDLVVLSLKDNGKGFDYAKKNGGFGIGNMKQRAQRIGGELEIIGNGEGGTILKVKIKS